MPFRDVRKWIAYVALDQLLKVTYFAIGEKRSHDILSFLCLGISQKAEGRMILAKAAVECRVLVPAIAVIVDLIVGP